MTDDSVNSRDTEGSGPDNRHYSRWPIISYFELGDDNGGIALDMSEGGLRIQAVRELSTDDSLDLRFQPAQSTAWIETQARIVWIGESKRIAGVKFVCLSDKTRRVLRGFLGEQPEAGIVDEMREDTARPIPGKSYTPHRTAGAERRSSQFIAESSGAFTAPSKPELREIESRTSPFILGAASEKMADQARGRSSFAIAVLFFCCVALLAMWLTRPGNVSGNLRGFRWLISQKLGTAQPMAPISVSPASSRVPEAPAPTPTTGQVPDSQPAVPPPSSPALDSPAVVLQVAAMSHEENANALVKSLTEKDLRAFVLRKDNDPLYRVLAGPYTDRGSVDAAKAKLSSLGIKFIEKRWVP